MPPEEERGPPEVREIEDVPVDDLASGFTGPFFRDIARRKAQGRDAKILVTARNAQTGVGKSNFCDFAGYVCDTTEEGFQEHKICIDPEQFFNSYGRLEPGSSLVLEEGEQLDARRAQREENVEGSHRWMMDRVREIVAFINLPSAQYIDKRMRGLADYWINILRRGRARVYQKKIHDIEQKIYYQTVQDIEWPNMDGSATFERMAELKANKIGEGRDDWISPSDHEEEVERARKEVRQDTRDRILKSIYNETELAARDIGHCSGVEIGASRIRQIASDTS